MLITISVILVLIGLIIIATIIIKKFPSLAILDVENIPGQKEAKFKEQIIRARLERDLSRWGKVFIKIVHFINSITSGPLHKAYTKLKDLKDVYRRSKKLTLSERREHIRNLFKVAEDDLKVDNLDGAESSLIEIISLESKNLSAFISLADVYVEAKKWAEARQTLGYALKLCKVVNKEHFTGDITLQKIYFSLSLVNKNLEDYTEALDNVQEALEFEPNNPRYLDLTIELAVLLNKKDLALEMFERLKEVNPDNAKLSEISEEISALPEDVKAEDETIY